MSARISGAWRRNTPGYAPDIAMRTLDEARNRLPERIDDAARGEDVVISRGDGASFRLVPVAGPAPRPVFGSARGQIEMSDDFDAPVDGFEAYAP